MRKSFGVLAAGFCALGIAGPARAVVLGFTGNLRIEIPDVKIGCEFYSCDYYPLVPATAVIPGLGAAAVNGSGAAGHLTALGLAGGEFAIANHVVPVTDEIAAPIYGLQVTAINSMGAFALGGGGRFGGVMPLHGVMKLCLFGPCSAAIDNVTIPLSVVGQIGTATVTGIVNVTVKGAPWTTGTAAIGTITRMGGVSPLSSTGAPGGDLNLVTPMFISINTSPGVWPAFGILNLDFIPEPGTLLVGGTAIASLVALGFVRSRRANESRR